MDTKKYIIEIKLKREKFSRWYYDKEYNDYFLLFNEFTIISNNNKQHFKCKDIDYFRIIEQ